MKVKKHHKGKKILALLILLPLLTACSGTDPITHQSTGIWDGWILYPLSQFIIRLSRLLGGNFGIGIIAFTAIIRTILIPLNQMQFKTQRQMMELQPEIEALKQKYPNRDKASMEMMQKEQQELFDKHGVNQFIGCLPLLVQLPILTALYQAISRTAVIKEGHFLWMNLGQPDPFFILPVLAAVLTFWNTYITMKANPQDNATTKSMMYFMPVMILMITISLPSALALYFVISNLLSVLFTYLFNNPYKIIQERQAKLQEERDRQKKLRKAIKKVQKR